MSNGLEKPPEDIPPDQLFRLLIRRPYPVTPIDLRIRGAESIALSVRAITWEEEMEIQDLHSQKKVSLSIGYITKCLMADGEQAFSSFEQTSMLSESEIKRLEPQVVKAISRICPCVHRSDMAAWEFAAYQGAKHFSNTHIVSMVMSCMEDGLEMVTQRPDRFYNMPLLELTEGHALAFRSACKVIWEARDEQRERSKNKRR